MSTDFHELQIDSVRQETDDAIVVSFAVPPALRDAYRFEPGQHLSLRAVVGGADLRRSYSICSAPFEQALRIGVRRVRGGVFSTWLHEHARAGRTIAVMPPQGRFGAGRRAPGARHILAIAGGSGITPILSLLKATLAGDPHSRVTLLYGNRTQKSTMFKEEIEDLKNRYMTRLALHHVFSREQMDTPLNAGRMDGAKVGEFLGTLVDPVQVDDAYVCGPHDMNDAVERALRAAGIAADRIHVERFGVPQAGSDAPAGAGPEAGAAAQAGARVVVIRDGVRREIDFDPGDHGLLDAAARAGLEVPYSCRSGVCATCRAKLIEGEVRLARNFALEPGELQAGFILACQAQPLTARVVISFDER